jgi:hypothetical protein
MGSHFGKLREIKLTAEIKILLKLGLYFYLFILKCLYFLKLSNHITEYMSFRLIRVP